MLQLQVMPNLHTVFTYLARAILIHVSKVEWGLYWLSTVNPKVKLRWKTESEGGVESGVGTRELTPPHSLSGNDNTRLTAAAPADRMIMATTRPAHRPKYPHHHHRDTALLAPSLFMFVAVPAPLTVLPAACLGAKTSVIIWHQTKDSLIHYKLLRSFQTGNVSCWNNHHGSGSTLQTWDVN